MADQADPQESRLPADYPVPMLLQPLNLQPCLKKVKGWWTYELCFGKTVKQYHSDDGITHGDAIDLGNFESDFDWSDEQRIKRSPFKQHKLQKYHSQSYVNGTKCDIHSHHRETEVRFYCDESATVAYIDRVDEPSTCSYIIIVKTDLLCSHPHTRMLSVVKTVDVVCQPMLPQEKFLQHQEEQEKILEKSYRHLNEELKKKRDILKDFLTEMKSGLFPSYSSIDSFFPTKKPQEVQSSEAKETALDFISRFVEEKRLKKLSLAAQKQLHHKITDSVMKLKKLPSGDMARMIKLQIETFMESQELFNEDVFLKTFQSLGMSALRDLGNLNDMGKLDSDVSNSNEHVKVKVKHIDAEIGEVNEENEQDPAIQQLEEEIGKELSEAGYTSSNRIEVHFITNKDAKESLSMTKEQAQQFKEMLLEVVGGISLEDNEKRRYSRLMDNYNIVFSAEKEKIVSGVTEKDENS
uniref:Uncharacterized protein LOC104266204 n=1 Tax=Phallusia mammillata TaxID=59560 RepID=A0A6F9DIC4_9ASCI|nr:uncharacterized protein LOC104266204 [Phallusia mammillata]